MTIASATRGVRGPLFAAVLAIVVVAPGIGIPSKWSDEAATTTAASRSLGDLWRMVQAIDVVHLVYYAGMHVWVDVFGASAVALRVPSLLLVAIAAAGVAVLARRLGGVPLLVAASVIFAVLPRVTWLGIEARSFAFTVAIAVWATVVLLRALDTGRMRWWPVYAALGALGMAVDIYLALLFVAHAATVAVSWRRVDRPLRALLLLVAAGAVSVAVCIPILRLAFGQTEQIALSPLSPGYLLVMFGVEQFFTGATPVRDRLLGFPPSTVWELGAMLLAVAGWALLVTGAVVRRPNVRPSRGPSLVAVAVPWIAAPALVLFAVSLLGNNVYTARYLSFTVPAAALLIGAGVLALRPTPARVAAIALVVLLAAPVYVFQRIPTGKQGTDWASVAAIVDANKRAGDGVYWSKQYGGVPGQTDSRIGAAYPEAFSGLRSVTTFVSGAASATLWGGDRPLSQSAHKVGSVDRIWVVSDHLGNADFHRERGSDYLRRHGMHLERSWTGVATDIFLWSR